MKRWIRNLFTNTPRKPIRRNPLSLLPLEDRITPADFRDVGGLRFFTDGAYTNAASTSSTNSLVQVGLTPGFGQTFTPLLDVPSGVSLGSNPQFAKINSSLSVGGLTFTGSNLAFAFDTPNNIFTLSGDASFSFSGVTITSSFGVPGSGTPGLVIQNGKLASVDVGITSSFTVGQVGFATDDLRLKFDTTAGNRFAISGQATASLQGTSPISLTTQFGESAEEPGLVIVNGKLSQFAVGVSSTFEVGGLALEAKDLTLAFTPGTSNYKFFGSASAKFGNNAETVGLELLLGNSAQPGVSIANGKLVSLNAGVTSNFNIGGVSINTKALTVTLDVPTNTFTLSGSAGFSFSGAGTNSVSLDVQLGQSSRQPGIKIVNGQLTELSVGVSGGFNLAGLSAEANALTFTYKRATNTYGFSGSARVSTAPVVGGRRVLDRVGVSFGESVDKPGILVQNGRLERIDIAVSGAVNLSSLKVSARQLRVQYADGVLQFTGGLTVSLTGKFTADADLVNGGLVINTDTGAVRLNGLRLGLRDTKLGTVVIRDAFVLFTQNSSNVISLSGGANVELPAGITVDGGFEIVDGRLRRIRLSLTKDPGVQIPSTPIFVQGVSGDINNLDNPNQLIVKGSMTFTAGPSYRISGRSVSLLQATVDFEVNLSGTVTIPIIGSFQPFGANSGFVALTGRMSLLGDAIPVGKGSVTIGFDKTTGRFLGLQANVELRLYAGFLVGSVDLDLNARTGNTTITGRLDVVIPEITIPTAFGDKNLGGQRLARAEVVLFLSESRPLDSSITFSGNLLDGVIAGTAVVTFRGDLTVSGTAFAIPFGPKTFQLPALFSDSADGDRQKNTSIKIRSVDRVPNSPTKDLRVEFEAFTGGDLANANVFFTASAQGVAQGDIASLSSPGTGQTYNPSTGIGTTILVNPGRFARPGEPFILTGNIFDSRRGLRATSAPAGPINGIGAIPRLEILGTERVANSPTNDLRVRFRATSSAPNTATVGFQVNGSADFDLGSLVTVGRLEVNQTFDAATGIGTTVIQNPERFAAAGQPFTLKGEITDLFGTRASLAVAVAPVVSPPSITAPATVSVPTLNQPTLVPANAIAIGDPVTQSDPNARLRLTLSSDSSIQLQVLSFRRPASIVIEQNLGRTVTLTGTVADLNTMLGRLLIARLSDNDAHSVTVSLSRLGTNPVTVQRDFTIPANAVLGIAIPSTAPSTVNAFGPGIAILEGTTIQLLPNTSIRRVGIKVVSGTGTNGRPPIGGDVLNSVVPETSPVFPFFDRSTFELIIAGDGTETLADFERAIQATTFQTTVSSGRVNIRITVTDSNRQTVSSEKQITITNTGAARSLARGSAPTFSTLSAANPPFVDVGPTLGIYVGIAPAPIAPELTVGNPDPADPIVSATVSLTGLFDATSDTLRFTPAGNIAGDFDPATGILALTGDATTTTEDFQAVLRSVTFGSARKNPTPFPREVLFHVTTAGGAGSPELFGRTSFAIEVPTVPPDITGTTSNLAFPPNAAPLVVFPDLDLVYPDEALPPPSVPLGTFIPGTTITRASVIIGTNYIRGEDFLTFTPVGEITGLFYEDSGELLLEGTGTLAEYEQVIRSVAYQNRNTSPSTLDRAIEVTLDDGSGSGNPPSLTRVVQPQSDGLDTIRVSGSLNPLVIPPTTKEASLGLTDLNYAPRPGETQLLYTIISTPQSTLGTVQLTDGTVATDGLEVPIEQLRGAKFIPSSTPRAGTVPFTFTIAGVNPVTGEPTETPITATVPIEITNVAPVAGNDRFTVDANVPVFLSFLGNDTDLNGDLLSVESFTQPANGKVTQDLENGSFTYTPNAGFAGNDLFTYSVVDGAGGKSTATVELSVVVPATRPVLVGFQEFAAGADVGGSVVNFYNPDGSTRFSVNPFPGFTGGVRTVAADFNNDGVADVVVGTGPGRASRVVILDGKTQAELFAVDPFEASFTGGVYVAAGDVNGDGVPDLAITPDEGGGPRVDLYSGAGFGKFVSFFGIDDPNFRGGARSSIADLNGDGVGDLIVVAGFGGGPRVAGFDGKSLGGTPQKIFGDFFAFEQTLRNGIFVSAGDINGDGFADLIAGGGPGGGPRVLAFDGRNLIQNQYVNLANFFGGDANGRGGIRIGVKDLDGDNRADLVVGSGAGAGSRVTGYLGKDIGPNGTPTSAFDFDALASFTGGVFVG